MAILNKKKITEYACKKNLLGKDYVESNIKGSSYDLRVGTIFIHKRSKRGFSEKFIPERWFIPERFISIGKENKYDDIYEIRPSSIVTMLTLESVQLPNNICATVFPMNRFSSKGLLILNPGHIDPGFNGPISICAINLSNETIRLKLRDDIFTIIFESLNGETDPYANNTYDEENRSKYEQIFYQTKAFNFSPSLFDLIIDYKDFEEPIKKVVQKVVNRYLAVFASILIFAATIVGTYISCSDYNDRSKIESLTNENTLLRDSLKQANIKINNSQNEYHQSK